MIIIFNMPFQCSKQQIRGNLLAMPTVLGSNMNSRSADMRSSVRLFSGPLILQFQSQRAIRELREYSLSPCLFRT